MSRASLNRFEKDNCAIAECVGSPAPNNGTTAGEMPRERLTRYGVEALKDHELLAIVLGTGYRGQHVLELARTIIEARTKEMLLETDIEELSSIKGVGKAKACLLVAAFELARRALQKGLGTRPVIACPADAAPLLADIRDQCREFFLCLYLNARNQLIHQEVISIGSLSASIVHPREVFQVAVSRSAASIILAHNHPSGDVSPSKEDIELTRRLLKAGEIMGIEILDHLIVSAHDFVSLKERGMM